MPVIWTGIVPDHCRPIMCFYAPEALTWLIIAMQRSAVSCFFSRSDAQIRKSEIVFSRQNHWDATKLGRKSVTILHFRWYGNRK